MGGEGLASSVVSSAQSSGMGASALCSSAAQLFSTPKPSPAFGLSKNAAGGSSTAAGVGASALCSSAAQLFSTPKLSPALGPSKNAVGGSSTAGCLASGLGGSSLLAASGKSEDDDEDDNKGKGKSKSVFY